jgi:surface antigen
MKFIKRILKFLLIFLLLLIAVYFIFFSRQYPLSVITRSLTPGDSLDSFNGVTVYNNGTEYEKSYGKNYSGDGTCYYGKKWQCVEFVKRYYHQHLKFVFKDGMGHAKSFFDPGTKHGTLNKRRGLLQFSNGGQEKPKVNDILVFDSKFGHVAIVSRVDEHEVEVIQQNIYMTPRECFTLSAVNGRYIVGEGRKPLGWLRKPLYIYNQ